MAKHASKKRKAETPDKGGRPRLDLTAEQIAEIPQLARTLTQEQIADKFGITDRTLRRRLTDSPDVLSAYKQGRASAVHDVADNLITRAMKGDTTAAIFYLKTQAGWKEVNVVQTQDLPQVEVK